LRGGQRKQSLDAKADSRIPATAMARAHPTPRKVSADAAAAAAAARRAKTNERWKRVAKAVKVRPYVVHWMEEGAMAAERRRIEASEQGRLEADALFADTVDSVEPMSKVARLN